MITMLLVYTTSALYCILLALSWENLWKNNSGPSTDERIKINHVCTIISYQSQCRAFNLAWICFAERAVIWRVLICFHLNSDELILSPSGNSFLHSTFWLLSPESNTMKNFIARICIIIKWRWKFLLEYSWWIIAFKIDLTGVGYSS